MKTATSSAVCRRMHAIVSSVVLAATLLCGCATGVFYSSPAKMAGLSLGMEKKAVIKVVGKPYACSTRMDGKEIEKAVFFDRPEEYAKIEGEELVFPMTKWNYRVIVLGKSSN